MKTHTRAFGAFTLAWAAAAAAEETAVAPEPATVLPGVTVTAEKQNRSLMDTGTSAMVFDQSDLERGAGLTSLKDVMSQVPNVVYVGTGNIAPAIRGVDSTGASQGSDAFIAGSRPRLNVQIDGRPTSYNEIVFGDGEIWDVQQVEVLRGAQSTLQGRNAIAGTVSVKTNDPAFENEGALRLYVGDYEQRRASGMLSGPVSIGGLGDSLAFRVSADWFSKQSFIEGFQGYEGVSDPGDFEALNLRGKLLYEPKSLPALRSLLTLNYADYRGPQVESASRASGFRAASTPDMPVFEPRSGSLISETEYRFTPALSLEGLLGATDLNVKRKSEPGQGIADIDGREYVVEPRLRWRGAGRAGGVAGLYLFSGDQDETLDFFNLAFKDHVRTAAAFGEVTLPLAEAFDLIAGARYEQEHHERHGGNGDSVPGVAVAVNLDKTFRAFLPKLGLAWHPWLKTTLGVQAARGYNGGGSGASIATDPVTHNTTITNYDYNPEYVWTYELYGRQELADGRVRLTGNLFYSSYRDMQLIDDLTPAVPTDFAFVVRNAKRVRTYGAEAGAAWLALRDLELYANLGALNARISEYPDSSYQGHELPNAPHFSLSAGATFKRRRWDAALNARYSDAYWSDVANQQRGRVSPYWVANAQAGYSWRRLRVYTAVDNVFDSNALLAIYSGSNPDPVNDPRPDSDFDTGNPLRSRTWRAGVQYAY